MSVDKLKGRFVCAKCGHREAEVAELFASASAAAAVFDISRAAFTTLMCMQCSYTELYGLPPERLHEAFDTLARLPGKSAR